jgi:hypothetical protein
MSDLKFSAMESSIFWDILPCTLLKANRRFGRTYRLHLQGRRLSKARNQHEEINNLIYIGFKARMIKILLTQGIQQVNVAVTFCITCTLIISNLNLDKTTDLHYCYCLSVSEIFPCQDSLLPNSYLLIKLHNFRLIIYPVYLELSNSMI